MTRALLVYEAGDLSGARGFVVTLRARIANLAIDELAPSFPIATVSPLLVQELHSRIDAADVVICLIGPSVTGGWAAWAVNASVDARKRVVCARIHRSVSDVPPTIAIERHVPIVDADADIVARFVERGELPVSAPDLAPHPLLSRFAQRR